MTQLCGSVIHAPLCRTFIGERCNVVVDPRRPGNILCQAQTIGFSETDAILSLLGNAQGLPRDAWVVPSGKGPHFALDDATPGSVLDGEGRTIARLGSFRPVAGLLHVLDIDAPPPALALRRPIDTVFETGVRAIDGLLTCGVGQRIGIFAAAGSGKTSLISMLVAHAHADIYVVGLVGERGREASEFIQRGIPQDRHRQSVLICSTSDRPAAERRNAAHMATSIAEHYRDMGKRVLLVIDSVTRYARALRDLSLSAGEAPARRGYPASVFEALPRLLERPGALEQGSITAFYTVLLEDEGQVEPIGEEVRSILDGHIYLSPKLAERAHYPAIDILKSGSRVMHNLATPAHRAVATAMRVKLSRLADLQLSLDLGEYSPGQDPDVDALLHMRPALNSWLTQPMDQASPIPDTLEAMNAFA